MSLQSNSTSSSVTTSQTQCVSNEPDTDAPDFTRTSSYYETGIEYEPEHKYYLASDVRRQVHEAPAALSSAGKYPSHYGNKPPLQLQAQEPLREFPVVPSPQNGSPPGNYTGNGEPGPVRAFYNETNRDVFDLGYHDPKKPPTGPRNGKKHAKRPYSLAKYHPAPPA